eukprot:1159526-Pelagomonas_calceolata.AAC.3
MDARCENGRTSPDHVRYRLHLSSHHFASSKWLMACLDISGICTDAYNFPGPDHEVQYECACVPAHRSASCVPRAASIQRTT